METEKVLPLVIAVAIALAFDVLVNKKQFSLRKFLVDTFMMVSISFVGMLIIEVFVFRLSLAQSLQTRYFVAIMNLLMGRPYGIVRDYFIKPNATAQRKRRVDGVLYLVWHTIPYMLTLIYVGASAEKTFWVGATTAIVTFIIGIFYGIGLDNARKIVHIRGAKEDQVLK